MKNSLALIFLYLSCLSACVPNVYLIDRPTLMEEEAAGDWPDLGQTLEKKEVSKHPVPLTPQQMKRKDERVTQTLLGDITLTPHD